jgi:tetratricopeptide (TPR) repeat protein
MSECSCVNSARRKKVKNKILRIVGLMLACLMCAGLMITIVAERAAAQEKEKPAGVGQIIGVVKDEEGKPMAGITVVIEPQGGLEIDVTTDANGKFAKPGLPVGLYTITFRQDDKTLFKIRANVAAGKDTPANIGMGEQRVKDFQKEMKKQLDDEAQFGKLKTHFNAGNAALEEEKAANAEMKKAAAADRAEPQGRVEVSASKALAEYQQALAAVTDPADVKNKAAVFAQIATAYELEGKFEEAAAAYQQDVAARPDPGAYNNLGNDLAKIGKMDEARAAYDQSAALDPAGAPLAYRNFAVVLFNAGKLKDSPAADLLKKATEAEPNNQQGWFLLGAALSANVETVQVGDKLTFKFPQGTAEAFQKCIDLDPKTSTAELARKNLEELKSMGLGVDTKSTAPKKKQ